MQQVLRESRAGADPGHDPRATVLLVTVYAALALLIVTEKFGLTTNDTRLELTEGPRDLLGSTFSLWNPDGSLGELQNQAYGYLFPQGAFFALAELAHMPGWLSGRLWSVVLLLVACEGARRVARALSVGPWAAAVAGLAYGLAPRHISELTVRSAEILPGMVLPWALLPILHAIDGRRRPWHAAVLSAAAFACGGGVNGTATAAPAALLAVVVGWAVCTRRLSWRFGLGWFALIMAVSAWWLISLVTLGAYSPPFFDYVEDARTTTGSSGFAAVLRGASNWVGYLTVGGQRWWPAGHDLSYEPWLVLGSGAVAVLGVIGLMRMRSVHRQWLLTAAAFGLAAQVAAHTGPWDGPFAPWWQQQLDGVLAPLRNVPKIDPVLRLPLAIGVGVLVGEAVELLRAGAAHRARRMRRVGAVGLLVGALCGLVAMAVPVLTADTRTPGWEAIPDYWQAAADHVAAESDGVTWVVPGAGFGIQTWGWSMEEPMQVLATSPWVTRSQVPLAPGATIRLLSQLETYLETGAGSPYLAQMLARIGVDTVVVRHDLDPEVAETPAAGLVAVALARSPGLRRDETFGRVEFGPAVEVFTVDPPLGEARRDPDGYDVRDVADAVTVASSVEDAVLAVGEGLVAPAQPIVLAGAEGWKEPAQIQGDALRRTERDFGRVHDALGATLTASEPFHAGRVVPDYPVPDGAEPVVAVDEGIASVTASSSRGWADTTGPVHPEEAPSAALDGDATTYWRPGAFTEAEGQWWQVEMQAPRWVGRIELVEPVSELGVDRVQQWRVETRGPTGETTVHTAAADPFTGRTEVDVDAAVTSLRVVVASAPARYSAVGLAEVSIDGLDAGRTLRLPAVPVDALADFLFTARPGARACVVGLLGPDCDPMRRRASEEAAGIDRTFTVASAGRWRVRGLAVASSTIATTGLLPGQGVHVRGSSWLGEDPAVSPRMAYDRDRSTSWIADPRDPTPSLSIDFGARRTLHRIAVAAPGGGASRPAEVRIESDSGRTRVVDLAGRGRFAPLRAREVTLTFTRRAGVADNVPLGVGEVRLRPGPRAPRLDGADSTGALCGFGPDLVVDGVIHPTRVEGNVGAVLSAGPLAVKPCGASRTLRLDAGEHRIRLSSTAQFQPIGLTLLGADRAEGREIPRRSRTLQTLAQSPTRVDLAVTAGEEAILSAPHNVNAGWTAHVRTEDGGTEELQPIVVDGWSQGWILPADLEGEIEIVFGPQRGYLVGLLTGLAVLALVILLAGWVLVRHRVGPAGQACEPGADPARHRAVRARGGRRRGPAELRRHGGALLAGVVAAAVAGVIAGPVAAGAGLVGVLCARWPSVCQLLAGGALLAALVWHVVALTDRAGLPSTGVDLLTAGGLVGALVAGLAAPRSGMTGRT